MNNFTLDNHIHMSYIIPMMNDDLMDMIRVSCDECVCADDIARIEHEEWERGSEERDRWAAVEATHGPLFDSMTWKD